MSYIQHGQCLIDDHLSWSKAHSGSPSPFPSTAVVRRWRCRETIVSWFRETTQDLGLLHRRGPPVWTPGRRLQRLEHPGERAGGRCTSGGRWDGDGG